MSKTMLLYNLIDISCSYWSCLNSSSLICFSYLFFVYSISFEYLLVFSSSYFSYWSLITSYYFYFLFFNSCICLLDCNLRVSIAKLYLFYISINPLFVFNTLMFSYKISSFLLYSLYFSCITFANSDYFWAIFLFC